MVDWQVWHRRYDDPASPLSQRLAAVRGQLARVLAARDGTPTQLVSICAGDGRDTIPVLAAGHPRVRAVLVEIDPDLGTVARAAAAQAALPAVEVRTADAGLLDTYAGLPPADVLLACGVFGNISDDDLTTTIRVLPRLLAPGAAVLWTRSSRAGSDDPTRFAGDPADLVRAVFSRHGFTEEAFIRAEEATFRVGVHRFDGPLRPSPHRDGQEDPAVPGGHDVRLFRFVR